MKKTSNAEYADDRLIDLRQLDHLQFDDVHEAYHLDWSSMLLLMRWLHDGEDSTIVIDRRGRLLNVERRYSEPIIELSREYHVYQNTMATFRTIPLRPILALRWYLLISTLLDVEPKKLGINPAFVRILYLQYPVMNPIPLIALLSNNCLLHSRLNEYVRWEHGGHF